VLVQSDASGDPGAERRPWWLAYLMLVLATLTRFETGFVAAGLAAGLAIGDGDVRAAVSARRRRIAGVLAAAALPTVAFALGNHAMGGGLLPNSVLGKGQGAGAGASQSDGIGPADIAGRLTQDPLLSALVMVAIVYLVFTWGQVARARLTAVTLVVAAGLHAALADVGWYERYQAYLIAIGIYMVLRILGELPVGARRRGLVALVLLIGVLGTAKVTLMAQAPLAADDIYRQQYQAGRFLERYYDGQPIATDQLGYISLFHHGPITDFAGLGDYEVLKEMPSGAAGRPEFWQRLTDERGFRVVAIYDTSALEGAPPTWVLGGTLHIEGGRVTGLTKDLQIWAATPDKAEVDALVDHLHDFASDLPDRMTLEINDYAGFQASAKRDRLALEALAADADADGAAEGSR
jgi:hypothetical protein